ncbi:hypothetical protein BDDG_04830 [Blastomyces dermatitidis ATCC 18188]|uniref:Fungal-type protein kinase domain-containing protein n=1 Tax=Ajellomyces dermatitidis (strain ATCC 18188 / CBS 674.68) TaxID=653446 RepID=F2TF74_AJEDA|nr:hypothetical protein BDDG_04830 [Blastomyces dermatitidis ATCC 18188]
MTSLTQSDCNVIAKHPLRNSLDHLRLILEDAEHFCRPHLNSYDSAVDTPSSACQEAISDLLGALMTQKSAFNLSSRLGNRNLASDISNLFGYVQQNDFSYEVYRALSQLVIRKALDIDIWTAVINLIITVLRSTPPPSTPFIQQTPITYNMSSLVNSSEYRKDVDNVLKEDIGPMSIDIPGFYEAFFGEVTDLEHIADTVFKKCMQGDTPQYHEKDGWKEWPGDAKEQDVLKWLSQMITLFTGYAEELFPTFNIQRRLLIQPHQPLLGSTAKRKLDIGIVDGVAADKAVKYHWQQILVPGELKNDREYDKPSLAGLDLGRYAREVLLCQETRRFVLGFTLCGSLMRLWEFDRLGAIASTHFDINKEGQRFVATVLGFLWMSKEQLGYDPTIIDAEGIKYIDIERNGQKERLIIDGLMTRAQCITGRATTCWKAHQENGDSQMPLVIKDSWQYSERDEEGELLREVTGKNVVNVARYYHHETVCVSGKDDDILNAVRKGLDVTQTSNRLILPLSRSESCTSLDRRSSSTTGRKRSSSRADTSLPPPRKRIQSSSPVKTAKTSTANRVHRRVIIRDYGKAIYKASSRVALLETLKGCIEGYESLHKKAGMLQCDISPNNLMMNEDDSNPSFRSFLIDLDLAIKEQREGFSGARGKTGTRAFMSIGVLLGEKHSFMHDLESFFWVLFWICIHYDELGKGRTVPRFEKWNYVSTEELAGMKIGVIAAEDVFLKTMDDNTTVHYQPLVPWVNKLRRDVFPGNGRWKTPNPNLYSDMKKVLQKAQNDPEVLK